MKKQPHPNVIARNRKSPSDEKERVNAYLRLVPEAAKRDGKDVAAVTTKGGIKGHGLMNQHDNRAKDRDNHRVERFVPEKEIEREMKFSKKQ
ncbi:MAG: hypothetical protein IJU64_07150 [Bacilli bacterium]|nr:hypothetical protein [Bacilli bacterium]